MNSWETEKYNFSSFVELVRAAHPDHYVVLDGLIATRDLDFQIL
jgi:hypothetical protein